MEEVMLNKSFIGSWGLESEDNIPHEIINRYRSDNERVYIYVPPYGGYNQQEHPKISDILITGDWHNGSTEVFYLVSGLTSLHKGGLRPKGANDKELQSLRNKIVSDKIKYGGMLLHEIRMSHNNDPKQKDAEEETFPLTFEAQNVYKPQKRCILTWDVKDATEDQLRKEITEDRVIWHLNAGYNYQRQRGYIDKEDLKGFLDDDRLWQQVDLPKLKVSKTSNPNQFDTNFVSLVHKEYDETTYTNLLYHFLNDREVFKAFSKDVLGIDSLSIEKFEIRREMSVTGGRIDLVVITDGDVIVIENKLRSGLNGIDKHHSISQLSTYYNYIEKKYINLRHHYYLLEPNYNDIDISAFDPKAKDYYTVIKYSRVYDFFKTIMADFPNYTLRRYAYDFLSALRIHTLTMEDVVNERFINAINSSNDK